MKFATTGATDLTPLTRTLPTALAGVSATDGCGSENHNSATTPTHVCYGGAAGSNNDGKTHECSCWRSAMSMTVADRRTANLSLNPSDAGGRYSR